MQVIPTTSPQDEATSDLVHRLRDDVLPDVLAGSGLDPKVGGITAAAIDFSDYAAERLPMFIGVVLLLSFLLLMATFRRSEEHTSELQSLMRISYAVFCLKKKTKQRPHGYMHDDTFMYY